MRSVVRVAALSAVFSRKPLRSSSCRSLISCPPDATLDTARPAGALAVHAGTRVEREASTPLMQVSRVTITRSMDNHGDDDVTVEAVDASGEALSPIESLGLIEYARIAISADVLNSLED